MGEIIHLKPRRPVAWDNILNILGVNETSLETEVIIQQIESNIHRIFPHTKEDPNRLGIVLMARHLVQTGQAGMDALNTISETIEGWSGKSTD